MLTVKTEVSLGFSAFLICFVSTAGASGVWLSIPSMHSFVLSKCHHPTRQKPTQQIPLSSPFFTLLTKIYFKPQPPLHFSDPESNHGQFEAHAGVHPFQNCLTVSMTRFREVTCSLSHSTSVRVCVVPPDTGLDFSKVHNAPVYFLGLKSVVAYSAWMLTEQRIGTPSNS